MQNRLNEIRKLSNTENSNYVKTNSNPADMLTKFSADLFKPEYWFSLTLGFGPRPFSFKLLRSQCYQHLHRVYFHHCYHYHLTARS